METFVVFDTHGKYKLLKGLLQAAGVWQKKKAAKLQLREDDLNVIHIGDLANCVKKSGEGDVKCLELVQSGFINTLLCGNHESPYINKDSFGGFFPIPEVKDLVRSLYFEGKIKAAHSESGILFTHAGLGSEWNDVFDSAAEAEKELNTLWEMSPSNHIFTDIGWERGGSASEGGILWADWNESKCKDFDQVVGHTPQKAIPPVEIVHSNGRRVICGDWGGKWGDHLAGCWVMPEGELDWILFQQANPGRND